MALVVVFVVTPLVAGLAGYAAGTTVERAAVTVAGVPLLAAVWAAVGVLSAPTSSAESDCHHCAELLGHWTDPLMVILPAVLAALWVVGAVTGAGARRLRRR